MHAKKFDVQYLKQSSLATIKNPANICWSSRRLQDVFKICLQDVLKTYLEDVLKIYLEDVFMANKIFAGDICI